MTHLLRHSAVRRHGFYCHGDSSRGQSCRPLGRIDLLLTDPPYG